MDYVKNIDVRITGQITGDSKLYELIIAKLKLISAEYGLELEELDVEEGY